MYSRHAVSDSHHTQRMPKSTPAEGCCCMQLSHEVCRAQDIPAVPTLPLPSPRRRAGAGGQRTGRGGFKLTKPMNTVAGSDNQPKNANTAARWCGLYTVLLVETATAAQMRSPMYGQRLRLGLGRGRALGHIHRLLVLLVELREQPLLLRTVRRSCGEQRRGRREHARARTHAPCPPT